MTGKRGKINTRRDCFSMQREECDSTRGGRGARREEAEGVASGEGEMVLVGELLPKGTIW